MPSRPRKWIHVGHVPVSIHGDMDVLQLDLPGLGVVLRLQWSWMLWTQPTGTEGFSSFVDMACCCMAAS